MNTHNFDIVNLDTDSISFCYPDFKEINKENQEILLDEINSILPEKIQMDHDGYYKTVVVLKTKNYILYDGEKISIKGSGLKASSKSPALKEMIKEATDILCKTERIEDIHSKMTELYNRYCKEAKEVKDITRWCTRKTLTAKTIQSPRSNETKVMDAIKGKNFVEGDRFRIFYLPDDSMCLVEDFKGVYNRQRLLENVYDTISVFETVIPVKDLFVKYTLKRNQKLLEEL